MTDVVTGSKAQALTSHPPSPTTPTTGPSPTSLHAMSTRSSDALARRQSTQQQQQAQSLRSRLSGTGSQSGEAHGLPSAVEGRLTRKRARSINVEEANNPRAERLTIQTPALAGTPPSSASIGSNSDLICICPSPPKVPRPRNGMCDFFFYLNFVSLDAWSVCCWLLEYIIRETFLSVICWVSCLFLSMPETQLGPPILCSPGSPPSYCNDQVGIRRVSECMYKFRGAAWLVIGESLCWRAKSKVISKLLTFFSRLCSVHTLSSTPPSRRGSQVSRSRQSRNFENHWRSVAKNRRRDQELLETPGRGGESEASTPVPSVQVPASSRWQKRPSCQSGCCSGCGRGPRTVSQVWWKAHLDATDAVDAIWGDSRSRTRIWTAFCIARHGHAAFHHQ